MAFFDLQIPFFVPVWRRIALIGVCLGWGAFEFWTQTPLWGIIFVGLGALAAYQLFFAGWPKSKPPNNN